MFLLMVFLWGSRPRSRAHGRQPHQPGGRRAVTGRQSGLTISGSCEAKEVQSRCPRKARYKAAVSSVNCSGGHTPTHLLQYNDSRREKGRNSRGFVEIVPAANQPSESEPRFQTAFN